MRNYRSRLLETLEHLRRDIIFHMDPWLLAQRLAGQKDRKLKTTEQAWYEKTVRTCTSEAAILGTEAEVRELQVT